MSARKTWIGIGVVGALALGWGLFRPDTLFINKTVNEALPAAQAASVAPSTVATPLAMGEFRSGAHTTRGKAAIHRLENGDRVLRLTEFETSNGPDVHVYLVAAPDVRADGEVKKAGFVDLGSLKGNRGDQNYRVPAAVDLSKYRAATIWCARFGVNFGTAPLKS